MTERELFMKIWKVRPGETMVAVCDREVIGKKICEGKLILDVSKDFYGGELVSREAAEDVLKNATVANLVGKDAVRCGISAGLVHEDAVIYVCGVPHAQFVTM
jgi:hypothetical protein